LITNIDHLIGDLDGDSYAALEDCDDDNGAIHPGADEVCDGVDNDCDDLIDDADSDVDLSDGTLWYADQDGDEFGDPTSGVTLCVAPDGWVADSDDCDDANELAYPGATGDAVGDGVDQNCDGLDGVDLDGDEFASIFSGGTDCDDTAVWINPDGEEVCDHEDLDEDCDGAADDDDEHGAVGPRRIGSTWMTTTTATRTPPPGRCAIPPTEPPRSGATATTAITG